MRCSSRMFLILRSSFCYSKPDNRWSLKMEKMRNLMDMNSNEMRHFLDSFDTVVTDCDGVLWLGNTPITGSLETLKKLESLGKKIVFVSNNSTLTLKDYCEKFRTLGYAANSEQIAIPSRVICWYLKKMGFDGKAFVLGTKKLQQSLKAEGINVIEPCPDSVEERIEVILEEYQKHLDVNAVIVDLDVNVNWMKISRSIKYLKNQQVLYIAGGTDRRIPVGRNLTILGVGAFLDIISQESSREPIRCAKPSEAMKNYIIDKFKIVDPSRCIFIGDSLENDMKFADLCGFGKIWVGSGIDTLEMAADQHRLITENLPSIPDYYLPSLGHLLNILKI